MNIPKILNQILDSSSTDVSTTQMPHKILLLFPVVGSLGQ